MGIYEPVVKMLDEVINDFKEEAEKAHETVIANGFLDPYDLSHLIKSNSKSQAALQTKTIISAATEDQIRKVSRQIETLMNEAERAGSYSVVRLYENILKALQESVSISGA